MLPRPPLLRGLRPLAVLLPVLALACKGEQKDPFTGDPNLELTQVIISPGVLSIQPQTVLIFQFYGRTAGGDSVDVALNWFANGGQLGPNGEFSSDTAGTFMVIGVAVQNPFPADTSFITVTVPPPTEAGLTVSPDSVALAPGQTRTFTATSLRSDGSTAPASVTWNAAGGTISSGGDYLAGQSQGNFLVIATSTVTLFADTSVVTIASVGATLTKVNLTPATVSLAQAATQQFTATGQFSDGSSSQLQVSFTAGSGSITPGGLYTAGQAAGTFSVIATHLPSGLADTSQVTVLPSTLAQIIITPPAASLQFGNTQQFTIQGISSTGQTIPATATWSATGGTINSSGFYVAGNTAGQFRVIATAVGTPVADTAIITVSAPPPVVVRIDLLPINASVLPNGTQQFGVFNVLSDGSTAQINNATFVVNGGSINAAGLYIAPAVAGSYRIIATSPLGFKDTSVVTVNAPNTLTAIAVTPDPANVAVNATTQFVTTGTLSDGSNTVVMPTYSATGGAITPGGVYTAGSTAGQFRVIATSGSLADTANVFIVSTPPAGHPNEPPGFTPFAIHTFNVIPVFGRTVGGILGSWWQWPQGDPDVTLQSDASAPESPSTTIQTRLRTGLADGAVAATIGGWDASTTATGQKSQVYFSMMIRILGTDYENHPVATKMGFFAYAEATTGAGNQGFLTLEGNGSQTISCCWKIGFRQQNNVSRNMNQNVNTTPIMTAGPWHQWEVLLKLNSGPDVPDGVVQMWVDGVQTHNYTNVVFLTSGATNKFFLWKFEPVYGGRGSAKTRDDFFQLDHVYISGIP